MSPVWAVALKGGIMAGKTATRTFGKQMLKCPKCGNNEPKELVDGPRRFNALKLLNPLNWILFWRCWEQGFEAYCHQCGNLISPDGTGFIASFLRGFNSGR